MSINTKDAPRGYRAVEKEGCSGCAFEVGDEEGCRASRSTQRCGRSTRADSASVIFVKIKKATPNQAGSAQQDQLTQLAVAAHSRSIMTEQAQAIQEAVCLLRTWLRVADQHGLSAECTEAFIKKHEQVSPDGKKL